MPGTGNKEPRNIYPLTSCFDSVWENILNARVDDNQYARTLLMKTDETDPMDAINFKITPDDIPVGSTIVGVYVTIRRYTAAANKVYDLSVNIIRSAVVIGDNKASAEAWPTTEALKAYGGPTDLWGIADLTDDEIRDRDIGVRLVAKNMGDENYYTYVDAITMQIYYTPPESTPSPTAANLSKHIRVP